MASQQDDLELWEKFRACSLGQLHQALGSQNEPERFAAARELQVRGQATTFELSTSLAKNNNAVLREMSAFVLGQLGTPGRPFRHLSLPVLNRLLEDSVFTVRAAAAAALGHLKAHESLTLLEKTAEDTEAEVRSNVAFALGNIPCDRSVELLLALTWDSDQEVVSWAVLALIMLDANTLEVRERFVKMLNTSRKDVRDEVICALARWNDSRATNALLTALSENDVNLELIQAAANIGDEQALLRLRQLRHEWAEDLPRGFDEAIAKIASRHG